MRPTGAFGQKLPQNVPSHPDSKAVKGSPHLDPQCDHKEYDRIGPDGLPHVGSVVWPGQVRSSERQGTQCLLYLYILREIEGLWSSSINLCCKNNVQQ